MWDNVCLYWAKLFNTWAALCLQAMKQPPTCLDLGTVHVPRHEASADWSKAGITKRPKNAAEYWAQWKGEAE